MSDRVVSPSLQSAIEAVESLSPDDLEVLIEIARRRLVEGRRAELAADVAEARDAYLRGEVRRGTVTDLLRELTA